MTRLIPKVLSGLTGAALVAAMVFAPLAFGAVEPWAYAILAVLAYSALAAIAVRAVMMGTTRTLLTPMLIPALLALLLLAAQYVQWPRGVVEGISPGTVEVYDKAATVAGEKGLPSLSPSQYRQGTREALICLSAYAALFVATGAYVRSRAHLARLASAIVCTGFGVSLLGILQNLSGTVKLYWWREPTHGGALFGPFVSRNQFATYAGLCFFVGLGLLLARGTRPGSLAGGWRESVTRHRSRSAHQNLLLGFATATTGAALFWSLSRAGIFSMLCTLAGVLIALCLAGAPRRKALHVAAVLLLVLGWVTYLGWEPIRNRFAETHKARGDPAAGWRWTMSADAARIGLAFPALGTGAGTFLSVYPRFRTLPTDALVSSPHNEYVQVLAEAGFTGLGILLLAIVLLCARVLRGLVERRNPYVRGFLAGGAGALLMVAIHSVVDFPMRSPAVAGTLAVVAGLLYRCAVLECNANGQAQRTGEPVGAPVISARPSGASAPPGGGANTGRDDGRQEALRKGGSREASDAHRRGNVSHGLTALLLVGAAWLVVCGLALDPLRGELETRLIQRAEEEVDRATLSAPAFVNASEASIRQHSPGNAQLYARLADFARRAASKTADPLEKLSLADKALKLRITAARLEPASADPPCEIAMDYLGFYRPGIATAYADLACELLPNDPWIRARLAEGFLSYGHLELAKHYLRKADELAEGRGIEQAKPLIADVRDRLKRAGGVL